MAKVNLDEYLQSQLDTILENGEEVRSRGVLWDYKTPYFTVRTDRRLILIKSKRHKPWWSYGMLIWSLFAKKRPEPLNLGVETIPLTDISDMKTNITALQDDFSFKEKYKELSFRDVKFKVKGVLRTYNHDIKEKAVSGNPEFQMADQVIRTEKKVRR